MFGTVLQKLLILEKNCPTDWEIIPHIAEKGTHD